MSFPAFRLKWLALVGASLVSAPATPAGEVELFYTNFENHPDGDDMLVATDGWTGNSLGTGSHGIDDGLISALGKVAFIGFAQPSARFVTVFRNIGFNPLANAAPKVRFECFLGIEDSTNGMRDSFFITIRNIAGEVLGNLRFTNSSLGTNIPIARLNGAGQQFVTDTVLLRGQLHYLSLEIDFSTNRWSAYLDGIAIFSDQVFHGGVRALDLGSIAAEWQLSAATTAGFGDNFMIFDEWTITAIEAGETPFVVKDLEGGPDGTRSVTYAAQPKFTYQLEYSEDLLTWKNDLPGSFVPGVSAPVEQTYTDTALLPPGTPRFYRVQRVFQP